MATARITVLARKIVSDPRKIPYLLVWKDDRHDGKIMEVVRLGHVVACGREGNEYVELKRTDGSPTVLRIVWQMLPRNGGGRSSCFALGATHHAVKSMAGNGTAFRDGRTESEVSAGDAAHGRLGRLGVMLRAYGSLPRPKSRLPYVFTSIDYPQLDEIVRQNRP